jgi:hypothetical protein
MDMAIQLLLKTRMPKWCATIGRYPRGSELVDPDELAMLERNVLAISKHVGLLDTSPQYAKSRSEYAEHHYESLFRWFQLANRIQWMFDPAERKTDNDWRSNSEEGVVGRLGVYIAWGRPLLSIRPDTTFDALVYHAAQMITAGTKFHTCEHCKTPFLGGGGAHGRNKKRSDARFCSDACRWGYHNASRRKTKSKSKS